MCGICGCGQPHDQQHEHGHMAEQEQRKRRRLQVELDLFSQNDRHAQNNRELFARRHLLVLNLVSGPGSGKTTLLRLINGLITDETTAEALLRGA